MDRYTQPPDTPNTLRETAKDVAISEENVPLNVNAGSIIPMKLTQRISTNFMKDDPINLKVFLDSSNYASGRPLHR